MWRRKKSSKKDKKNAASPVSSVNRSPKANSKEKIPIVIEEENEVFETPRSQLDHTENEGSNLKDIKPEKSVIETTIDSDKIEKKVEESKNIVDNEKTIEVPAITNEVQSSNEKETVEVPFPNEDISIDNGDDIVNEVIKELENEDKKIEAEKKNEEVSKELSSEILDVVENEQAIPVSEVPKVVEANTETLRVDENMNKLNEEIHEHSESLNGVKEVQKKEVEKSTSDAEKTEISERNEVDCRSTITRRATICNCCGLFDVLTSSDR